MEITQAAILGIVQGITEFLPISSSAHLILFPWFLGWPQHSLAFDVALHIGTLLSIFLYFASDFAKILQGWLSRKREESKFIGLLILGTIPGALAGLFGAKMIEEYLRGPALIAFTLIFVGILLWIADQNGKKRRELNEVDWMDALLIGIAQAFALIPGVSRAGITMTVGLFLGFARPAAARFSFMLAAPIMLGAGLFEARKLTVGLPASETWVGWGMGLVLSAITGMLTIRFLLAHLQKDSFQPFVIYRIVLGVGIAVALLLK